MSGAHFSKDPYIFLCMQMTSTFILPEAITAFEADANKKGFFTNADKTKYVEINRDIQKHRQ